MPAIYNRRSGTKVRNGKVVRKNRTTPSTQRGYVVDRQPPGRDSMHVLTKKQLFDFLDLIPNWPELSRGLERIALTKGEEDDDGYYQFFYREKTAQIELCSWRKELWVDLWRGYFEDHRAHFDALGVSYDVKKDKVHCRFTMAQARAFTLLHVFLHELGHHHERFRGKSAHVALDEDFAERFANRLFDEILPHYVETFGNPAREVN